MNTKELEQKAALIRVDSLKATTKASFGHTGSIMSVVEILVALYYGKISIRDVMLYDSENPGWEDQDYLVLSKSNAAPALYSILADLGFFHKSDLKYLSQINSNLQSGPFSKVPGVSATVASHGHGLSIALGLALSLKADRKNNKVFTVMGDKELQEGQVWEAAMAAANYNLSNLVVFVDNNKIQASSSVISGMSIGSIQDKFEGFGWNVIQVLDGHNFESILTAVERAFKSNRKPVCIWAHTVAGKGIDFAEGKVGYQKSVLSESELSEVIPKLNDLA